jgi:hypothetical protein
VARPTSAGFPAPPIRRCWPWPRVLVITAWTAQAPCSGRAGAPRPYSQSLQPRRAATMRCDAVA